MNRIATIFSAPVNTLIRRRCTHFYHCIIAQKTLRTYVRVYRDRRVYIYIYTLQCTQRRTYVYTVYTHIRGTVVSFVRRSAAYLLHVCRGKCITYVYASARRVHTETQREPRCTVATTTYTPRRIANPLLYMVCGGERVERGEKRRDDA